MKPNRTTYFHIGIGLVLWIATVSCGGTQLDLGKDYELGGDFTLQSANQSHWQLSQNAKRINLIFFGYTSCPDYCPMTLAKFKKVNEILGKDKDQVQFIFISVDSKKDKPDSVQKYVDFYIDNGVGLTGSSEEIQKVSSLFKAYYEIHPDSIDHSTYTYLVDHQLKTRFLFRHQEKPEEIAKIIQLLLGKEPFSRFP